VTALRFPARAGGAASATQPRSGRLIAFAFALVVAAIAVGMATPAIAEFFTGDSAGGVVAGVLLVFVAGSPLLLRFRRHGFDAPALYALATCGLIGLTSLAWLSATPDEPAPGVDQTDVADALRLVALGLLTFTVGALIPGRARWPDKTPLRSDHAPSRPLLLGLFALSTVAVLGTFSVGAYGYISTVQATESIASIAELLALLAALGDLVVLVTALAYFHTRDKRYLLPLVGFTILSMAFGFAGGNKKSTILSLALVLGAYAIVARKLPWRAIIATTIFLFVFVVPTNLRYRESVRVGQESPRVALRQALTTPLDFKPRPVAQDVREYVLSRFRSIDSVALVRTQTPSPFPFAGGEKYFALPAIIVVPRAVWPGKPVLDDAGQFTHTYGQVPAFVRSATEITQIGDLYRNFGYTGVVFGMFLWGITIALFARLYVRYCSPRVQALYVYTVVTAVVYVEADLPALIATASKGLPLAALVAWFLLPGREGPPGYHHLKRSTKSDPALLTSA
jgi:hypothetical protein